MFIYLEKKWMSTMWTCFLSKTDLMPAQINRLNFYEQTADFDRSADKHASNHVNK